MDRVNEGGWGRGLSCGVLGTTTINGVRYPLRLSDTVPVWSKISGVYSGVIYYGVVWHCKIQHGRDSNGTV